MSPGCCRVLGATERYGEQTVHVVRRLACSHAADGVGLVMIILSQDVR